MRYFLIFLLLAIPSANAATVKAWTEGADRLHISLSGEIVWGDQFEVQRLVEKHYIREKRILYLNSIGGEMAAAIEMGYVIRANGIYTSIPHKAHCLSACSMVFVAGWDHDLDQPARFKHPKSLLAVHHPYHRVTKKKTRGAVMKKLDAYLLYMGAGKNFRHWTTNTPYKNMRFIKNDELRTMVGYTVSSYEIKWQELQQWDSCDAVCDDLWQKARKAAPVTPRKLNGTLLFYK